MTQILLLGTFHYSQSSINIFSKETQREIQQIANSVARFKPDAVAIELPKHQQTTIDESYSRYLNEAYINNENLKDHVFFKLTSFGEEASIMYSNEVVQLGYRLGRMLDLERIYGIDADIELNDFVWENLTEKAKQKITYLYNEAEKFGSQSLLDICKGYNNSKNYCRLDYDIYLELNTINNGNYEGAMMFTQWYERNLKIFSHIQELAKDNERIFVLYGVGHLKILRDLINASSDLELVDVSDYL